MFTGIIECIGRITDVHHEGTNKHFIIESPISHELHVDQSIAHNGVCLTVTTLSGNTYTVTAVAETLTRSSLGHIRTGDSINIERCVKASSFLDGHIVQGHVDTTAICTEVSDKDGSYEYTFRLHNPQPQLLIDKGSITVNGVSLTVISPTDDSFKVAIIPYTYEHTTFKHLQTGHTVNIEYDVIGKYVSRLMAYKTML